MLITTELFFKKLVNLLGFIGDIRECCNVSVSCMYKHDIGIEVLKFLSGEHCVLPILSVLRLVESRLNSHIKEKNLHNGYDIVSGRTAENGDVLFQTG